jgi:hypothetical protein
MPLKDQQIRSLLVACAETHSDEIDCEEFLSYMAEYSEVRAAGRSVPEALSKVEAHERLCPNCSEESRALVELVRAEREEAAG